MALTLLLIIGVVLVFYAGARRLYRYSNVDQWKKVHVDIVHTGIGSQIESIRFCRVEYFYPKVRYAYSVAGRSMESASVSFDKKTIRSDNRVEAERLLQDIIASSSAYYNPRNIADAVMLKTLSPLSRSHDLALVVAGVLILLAAGYLNSR